MSGSRARILELIERVGAIKEGHFRLASDRHANKYLLKDLLYVWPANRRILVHALANLVTTRQVVTSGTLIAGAAVGGVPLCTELSSTLDAWIGGGLTRAVGSVYADKDERTGELVFKRGYAEIVAGKNVLLVEDVLTSGGTVVKLRQAVERIGGRVIGVVGIANRGNVQREELGVPWFETLVRLDFESWAPDACPLCAAGEVPISTTIGKGLPSLGASTAR